MNRSELVARLTPLFKDIEKRGIFINKSVLEQALHEDRENLIKAKEYINRQAGFMVNLEDYNDWGRALKKHPRYCKELNNWEMYIGLKNFHLSKELYYARELGRKFRSLSFLKGLSNVTDEYFRIYPYYIIRDDTPYISSTGHELNSWSKEIKNVVSRVGYYIIEAKYNNLELSVLQHLSGDPELKKDLTTNVNESFADRLFNYGVIPKGIEREEEILLAKTIHKSMYPGESLEETFNKVFFYFTHRNHSENRADFYKDQIQRWRAKWSSEYKEAFKLLEYYYDFEEYYARDTQNVRIPDKAGPPIGVKYYTKNNFGCIPFIAGDLIKEGILNVYEDIGLQKLNVEIIAVTEDSIILYAPCNELNKINEIEKRLEEDLRSVGRNEYILDVSVTVGDSWGKITEDEKNFYTNCIVG